MTDKIKQLNPFELKSFISSLVNNFTDVNDLENFIEEINLLDSQKDKKTISKLLYKELYNLKTDNGTIICFLLERYTDKEDLTKKLWELLKNPVVPNNVKIIIVNFLRGLDSNWDISSGNEILDSEILDADTKEMLNRAIVNPEVQIDFLDFLNSLSMTDKKTLINSLKEDYTQDAIANILIPVFLSEPTSEIGLLALDVLGDSKSQLAFHALNNAYEYVPDSIKPFVKKNISTLKIAGIREDNSIKFYADLLKDFKPYIFCTTCPDGHGNQAIIFSRKNSQNRVKFTAIVIDDYNGIRDCFGFNDISKFECDAILERFYKNENEVNISPKTLKTILLQAEKLSYSKNKTIPYEYVCWKNLLSDIEIENKTYFQILSENIEKCNLSINDVQKIYNTDFTQKWFLEPTYSDEFEELLETDTEDYDKLINDYADKIFDNEENQVWSNRLLSTAFLEFKSENLNLAQRLYNLYFDENLKRELYKNILRKSIYEYYVNLKYNTELNDGKFSIRELDKIITKLEDLWVCTR
mgnify:CR=1 FL=1